MKRSDLILLFINDGYLSNKQIGAFFKLLESDYYRDVFSEVMVRSELPEWQDGKFGEWSRDIKNDLIKLEDMGFIRVSKKSNRMMTFQFDVYSLTEAGISKRTEIKWDVGEIIVESIYQMKERLERKRE